MNAGAAQQALMALQTMAYALIEMEAMKAENMQREANGLAMAYDSSDFMNVAETMIQQSRNYIEWVKS